MKHFDVLIIGGGLASARAVQAFRESGATGSVGLVSSDSVVPYHRPPLSKRYLRGEAELSDTLVEPLAFYAEQGVDLMLDTEVVAVRGLERIVETAAGGRLGYGKLLVATGARPRVLRVPGADLDGIFTLRTLSDSTAIRDAAAGAKTAVVVGGGFIGTEVAASLSRRGLAVTLVDRESGLFGVLAAPDVQREIGELFTSEGVRLVFEDQVSAFEGVERVSAVQTRAGLTLDADLVVVGIGVEPAVSFLRDSGVALDDGVLVDDRFETSVPGIYAAGDVARFQDPIFGRSRRIEHWSNANHQGGEVGRILAGGEPGPASVSSFFTEPFGVTLTVFGDSSRHDELVLHGSLAERDLVGLYGDGERLVAALSVGQDGSVEARLKQLIAAGSALDEAQQALESADGRAGAAA